MSLVLLRKSFIILNFNDLGLTSLFTIVLPKPNKSVTLLLAAHLD